MIQDVQALLATTLADCPVFRTFVGAADAAAALLRIHHDAFPPSDSGADRYTADELEDIRPCAVLFTPDNQGFVTEKDATGDYWRPRGTLYCWLYRTAPSGTLSAVAVSFRETVGALLDELQSRSTLASFLATTKIVVNGPFRTPPDEINTLGDQQVYELVIDWGTTG